MAVGKSGAAADRDRLSIRFGDILVAENGWVAPGYREADGRGLHEERTSSSSASTSASAAARRRSGPAT